jgi:hypothetical protein
MNNKKTLPKIVSFAILTSITAFAWIGFEVYRALTREPSPSVAPGITAELSPTLDLNTLSTLEQRIQLEEVEIGITQIIDLTNQEGEEQAEEQPSAEDETTENTETVESPEELLEATEEGEIVP